MLVERAEAGLTRLPYSAADVERLRALVAEADAAMARRPDPFPYPATEPKP